MMYVFMVENVTAVVLDSAPILVVTAGISFLLYMMCFHWLQPL